MLNAQSKVRSAVSGMEGIRKLCVRFRWDDAYNLQSVCRLLQIGLLPDKKRKAPVVTLNYSIV